MIHNSESSIIQLSLSPRALLSIIENLKNIITNRQTKDYSRTSYFLNENEHDIDSMDNNSFIYL